MSGKSWEISSFDIVHCMFYSQRTIFAHQSQNPRQRCLPHVEQIYEPVLFLSASLHSVRARDFPTLQFTCLFPSLPHKVVQFITCLHTFPKQSNAATNTRQQTTLLCRCPLAAQRRRNAFIVGALAEAIAEAAQSFVLPFAKLCAALCMCIASKQGR